MRSFLGTHFRTTPCAALFAAGWMAAGMQNAVAQEISFRHLTTADGAPDNYFIHAATDRTGVLWLGSRSGLASFDGVAVRRYTTRTHPALPSDAVTRVVVDAHNRIWLGTDRGIAVLDAWRRIHRVYLPPAIRDKSVTQLFEIADLGIIMRTGRRGWGRWYALPYATLRWQTEPWLDTFNRGIDHVTHYDGARILLCSGQRLRLLNLAQRRIELDLPLRHTACCRAADGSIFAASSDTPALHRVSVAESRVQHSFQGITDLRGEPLTGTTTWMEEAPDGSIFLATRAKGLYRFYPSTNRLHHFTHDPFSPQSISDNRLTGLEINGGLLVVLTTTGANYANLASAAFSYYPHFILPDGTRIEEPVRGVAEDGNGTLWVSTATHLLHLDARGIATTILAHPGDQRSEHFGDPAVASDGSVWVPVRGEGIAIFGANGILRRWLKKPALPTARIRFLKKLGDGWLAAGTESKGVFRIRTADNFVDTFAAHPLLRRISPKRVIDLLPEGDSVWWIATSTGGAAWRYDFKHHSLVALRTANGLLSDRVYGLARDAAGALYVATFSGLTVFRRDGSIRQCHISTSLLHNRTEALVTDAQGRVWATNYRVLLRFDTGGARWRRFDERNGLPGAAFSVVHPIQRKDGSLVFATDCGIVTVPREVQDGEDIAPPAVHLFRELGSAEVPLDAAGKILLSNKSANLTFHYRAAGIAAAPHTLFRHRMEGLDEGWSAPTEDRAATYNLAPGDYRFRVEASGDGRMWRGVSSPAIHIPKPWWARPLAIAGWIVLGALCVYLVVRARVDSVQRRARMRGELAEAREVSLQQRLELEQVISYFAKSIGAKTSVDDILWDVTRHCIARLGLEDCVIYLLDSTDGMLHQRAAWGPKTTEENRIVNPLAISIGEGITGAAAASSKPILVPDTAKDARYIVDDARRGSELAVPMLDSNSAVMGVIDSEHPRTNFYTERHLLLLSTIAALCADKIEMLQAEQRTRAKELEVLTIGKDLAHSQLTALRSQMNPHFLFNSLNAIQECVVTGQMDAAYDYLSRFSRLLRLVLRHSEHDFISLGEEVEVTELYLSLEALRLRHQFSYDIVVDESLDADDIRVPSLLLQPFVENAVWHGLMHKEGERRLRIAFREEEDALVCIVEDNGVGRAEAAQIRAKRLAGAGQESVGTRLSRQKLELLQSRYGIAAELSVEDLYAADGAAAGTRVVVRLSVTT